MDLEKIKCVETVEPEPNAPQERMYAFQVNATGIFFFFFFVFQSFQKLIKYPENQETGS